MKQNKLTPILAIETSDILCGVCVYLGDNKYTTVKVHITKSHSEKLPDAVDQALKLANLKLQDIKLIAVSSGPGSFTGLRIGYSFAKGLASGSNIPMVSVPAFEALALQIIPFMKEDQNLVIANKVNTKEIYYASFKKERNIYKFVEELRIITAEELEKKQKADLYSGNAFFNKKIPGKIDLAAPDPYYLVDWYLKNDSAEVSNEPDTMEPYYLKNFIVKEKKNV